MTKKSGGKGRVKKLKLKKETVRDLSVKGGSKAVKGGGSADIARICGPTFGCATAAYTNCNVSCLAVCGGGRLIGG